MYDKNECVSTLELKIYLQVGFFRNFHDLANPDLELDFVKRFVMAFLSHSKKSNEHKQLDPRRRT